MTVPGLTHLVGGGGGLGEHVVNAVGCLGGAVVVADVDLDAASRVAAAAHDRGVTANAVAVDVRDDAHVDALVEGVAAFGSGLGSVVNAVGVTGRYRIADLTAERMATLLDVNVGGVVRLSRAAVRVMRAGGGGGVIVNVASAAALRPSAGSSGYSATKGAVVAFSRSLAAELAPEGIRVWAVCPPAIETGMYVRMLGDTDEDAERIASEARRPLGRVIRPEEIADLIAFLVAGRGPPYGAEPFVV